jgi:hypothetical protein
MAANVEAAQRERIISVLQGGSALKISFRLAGYVIDAGSFLAVIDLLRLGAVKVSIDTAMPAKAAAMYDAGAKAFLFPYGQHGMSVEEKSTIVHESVHCYLDYLGDGKYHRRVDNEAAGHVAFALYFLDATSKLLPNDVGEFDIAVDIAKKIRASRSSLPTVSVSDLDNLRKKVLRVYRRAGFPIKPLERDPSSGIVGFPVGSLRMID